MQVPWCGLTQSFGHGLTEQSLPIYPLLHAHLPCRQTPYPLQSLGHVAYSQNAPSKPAVHLHTESFRHSPRAIQSCSHFGFLQLTPSNPLWHVQLPLAWSQSPFELQFSGHEMCWQCSPSNPRLHIHTGFSGSVKLHFPFSPQSLIQFLTEQSFPTYPESHTHL